MIKLEEFDNFNLSGISYGGHGGSKKGILINGEKWFLKYPKSTKSMNVEGLSYSTTPISEYIGSHIYETIGLDTHKTKLGIANGKVVGACKDFYMKALKYKYEKVLLPIYNKLTSINNTRL